MRKKRMEKIVVAEPENSTTKESVTPVELPPPVNVQSVDDDSQYLPWWTGIKEVSIYLNEENTEIIDSHFKPCYPVV